jgi:hypothetical protein
MQGIADAHEAKTAGHDEVAQFEHALRTFRTRGWSGRAVRLQRVRDLGREARQLHAYGGGYGTRAGRAGLDKPDA